MPDDRSSLLGRQSSSLPARLMQVVKEVFTIALCSFGGPPVHVSLAHERFVRKLGWLSDDRLMELFSIASAIPGPSSSQLITSIGLTHAGPIGGVLAIITWIIPGWVIMTILGMGAKTFLLGDIPDWLGGLAPAAVSLIVIASVRLWKKVCGDDTARCFVAATAAFAIIVAHRSTSFIYPIVLGSGGLIILAAHHTGYSSSSESSTPRLSQRSHRHIGISPLAGILILIAWFAVLVLLAFYRPQDNGRDLTSLFFSLYWIGSIVFGGGHVVLPMLLTEIVNQGWMTKSQFLAGFAIIQLIPGPLFNISTYIGAVAFGPVGALACVCGLFGPGILLFFGLLPLWDHVRGNQQLQIFLSGVNAAAVGLVIASFFLLWRKTMDTDAAAAIALVSGLSAGVFDVPGPMAILLGVFIGLGFSPSLFTIGH